MEHAGPRDSSEGPKRRPILELGIPMKPQNSTSAPAWATVGTGPFGSHCEKKKSLSSATNLETKAQMDKI